MAQLQVDQIPVLSDNYVYLVHEPRAGVTGVVDPAVAAPVLDRLRAHGWKLDWILSTHHHADHTGGNLELKQATGCRIAGAKADAARIPGIDLGLAEGDRFQLGDAEAEVLETPGHTSGHISYWFADAKALFCADTLFSLGCGRVFEGTLRADVALARQVRRPAGRRSGLLRPRVHPGQCPLRAHRRPRQPGAAGARRGGRPPARGRQADRAQHARRRAGRQSVPARRTIRRSASASAWRTRATRRCSPRSASARTASRRPGRGRRRPRSRARSRLSPRPRRRGGARSGRRRGCARVPARLGFDRLGASGRANDGSGRATGRARAGLRLLPARRGARIHSIAGAAWCASTPAALGFVRIGFACGAALG